MFSFARFLVVGTVSLAVMASGRSGTSDAASTAGVEESGVLRSLVTQGPQAEHNLAPAPWIAEDPADSLYRLARNALNSGDYRLAVRHFRDLRKRFPDSGYAGDAHYWEAFALTKLGSREDLKLATELLEYQGQRYPEARTRRDARELQSQIRADLARMGDAQSMEYVSEAAAELSQERAGARTTKQHQRQEECDNEDDERVVALMALMQMQSDRALPILKKVLARRDEGSVCLRRRAMFIVSQQHSPETTQILLQAVRTDPDPEVKEQAVFWLSQAPAPEAIAALDSILQHAADPELQEKAVFALSQQSDEAATRALRNYLERGATSDELKVNIVFWLAQRGGVENSQYLRELYKKTDNPEVKEKILFSLSQGHGAENEWIMGIALDKKEPVEMRKQALFWAAQSGGADIDQLLALYDGMQDRDVKQHLIFVYSQRSDPKVIDKLLQIARTETDKELREKAIFWLGQSGDPRVADLLMEIINQ
ncbi:MAG TPA: HEAT repeat domain-containing protein [Gemmatimonadales bacterium]|nr:HEAT repeat domain-containing protein [Gemmatimonadales bacterium]